MARTAKLELEIDSTRAKAGASTADQVLQGLKRQARSTFDELRSLAKGSGEAGEAMKAVGRAAGTADAEVRRAGAGARGAGSDFRELGKDAKDAERSMGGAAGGSRSLVGSLGALKTAIVAVATGALVKEFLDSADATKKWESQLKLAIPATETLGRAQKDVRAIAAATRGDLDSSTDLYAKFSRASAGLGRSQSDAARATETFSKTLKISGTDTQTATGITRQFGQALSSGVLRGDEFNTLMEGSERTTRLLANSLGVTTGELRGMAAEGQLTADKLMDALTSRKFTDQIDQEFRQVPITFGEAMTRVKDTGTVAFGAFDRGGEFSQALINFMLGGVDNMDTLEQRAVVMGVNIRATLDGLGSAWDQFGIGASTVFGGIKTYIIDLREDIGQLLGTLDQAANLAIGPKRLGESTRQGWENVKGFVTGQPAGQVQMTPWSDMKGAFQNQYDQSRIVGNLKRQDRWVMNQLPVGTPRPDEMMDFVHQTGRFDPAMANANRANPNAATNEIGRVMTGKDLDDALGKIGAVITSRGRTPAQQQAQIDKWNNEDPRTRGIRPAGVNSSDHVTQGDRTRDIAKTGGVSLASITAAVGKDNIKQLINEGDHFHLALKGGAGGKGAGGKTEAEKEADLQEKLAKRRKEDEADFWQQLKDQGTAAAMLPAEAERYNAQLKLRKILNDGNVAGERELTKEQKAQVDALLAQKNAAEFTRSVRMDAIDQSREGLRLEDEFATLSKSTTESEVDNLAVQQKLWPFKLDALNRGLDLQSETVKSALAEVEARERSNQALAKRNAALREGVSVAERYRTGGSQQDADLADITRQRNSLGTAYAAGRVSDADFKSAAKGLEQAVYEVKNRFVFEFSDAVTGLADEFSGKVGTAMQGVAGVLSVAVAQSKGDFSQSGAIGKVIGLFNGPNGNPVADSAKGASQNMLKELTSGSTFKNPLQSLSTGFSGFKGDMQNMFGKGGSFTSGLGSVLGKAGMGAQIGQAVQGLASVVGIKLNKTGSQVGGAIGGAVGGPLGAVAGSVIGGIGGNLLAKKKYGTAVVTGTDDVQISGNSKSAKSGAGSLGGSVADGVKSIADQLGATLGSYSVSIGMYKDKYRVSTTGYDGKLGNQGSKTSSLGIKDFGVDGEAAAVLFAITDAIKDGALRGLSPTIQKIIANAGEDLDAGVRDALTFKSAMDEYKQRIDPVGFAMEALDKQFQSLTDIMNKAGATTQEYANKDALYLLKRNEIQEQANASSLKSMQDYLQELRGGTSSVLSPETRLANSKTALDALDSTRSKGGAVNFDDYKQAANDFLAASRDANGSNLAYFRDMDRVTGTVDSLIAAQKAATPATPVIDIAPVVSSINAQTASVTGLLAQISGQLGTGSTPAVVSSTSSSYAASKVAMLREQRYFALN